MSRVQGPQDVPLALPHAGRLARAWVELHGSPLLILDCQQLRTQYRRLATALPGVDLHYAMKALPHPAVLATLHEEGCWFDVSSHGEIEALRALDIGAERTIHTHPIKRDQDIRAALSYGCRVFVVDNAAELAKFVPYRDVTSVLLRIGFRGSDAVVDLAKKFGCAPQDAWSLLERAARLGVRVEGLSFHVGSQCGSSGSHLAAIHASIRLIAQARRAGLPPLRILDIGGGFPISYQSEAISIETFCAPIRAALAHVPEGVRVVAEPGRFLAGPAVQAIATITGKALRAGTVWYYLDDGVFGSYSGQVYDSARYPLSLVAERPGEPRTSVLAGPTCDSIDIIAEDIEMPEANLGDLILAGSMGAYTAASASAFNMLPRTKIVAIDTTPLADLEWPGGADELVGVEAC